MAGRPSCKSDCAPQPAGRCQGHLPQAADQAPDQDHRSLDRATREGDRAHRQGRPGLARRDQILLSIKGIGPVTAAAILPTSPRSAPATPSRRPCSPASPPSPTTAATGQARADQGWTWRAAYRHLHGRCRRDQFQPRPQGVLRRLAAGQTAQGRLTAVTRKLVVLANTLIREDRLWKPTHAQAALMPGARPGRGLSEWGPTGAEHARMGRGADQDGALRAPAGLVLDSRRHGGT